jgi:hypothetical protein
MQPRNVAFVGAICVTIGWLLASTLTPPVARVQSRPPERVIATDALQEVKFDAQIQLRQRDVPPPQGRRNPFLFATTTRAVMPEPTPGSSRETASIETTPLRAAPPYLLSGIAITGDAHTAVLTTGNDVHMVKVNDSIGGYTVVEITETSVTLVRDGERHVLRFMQ